MAKQYSHAHIENHVERWKKRHSQGFPEVVIKYGEGPMNQFSSSRLRFQYAIDELDAELLRYLRPSLEDLVPEIQSLGMPPERASQDYEFRSNQEWQFYTDTFRRAIAELRSATEDAWGEYERTFSESEMEQFASNFKNRANRLRLESTSVFNAAVWGAAGRPADADAIQHRANRRSAFVQPILRSKGWTQPDWANEAEVDKNTVRDYLNGTTKNPRPDPLRKMATALGVDAAKMPR